MFGLSLSLVTSFGPPPGHVPALLGYGAFCGGATILVALIGLAATFVESLEGVIILALDGVATFFLLAGGIVS